MKFNTITKKDHQTINYEGAVAWKMDAEMELYTAVVTSALSDTFYESADSRLQRIRALCKKVEPAFIARLAVYVREKMYLRSMPLVLTVELAALHQGDDLVRRVTNRVIKRADEITEILAYYQMRNRRNGVKKLNRLSKQLQHGIADAFNRFDSYQFAKYNRKTDVSLKDALFLTHPMPKDKHQQAIFDAIVHDALETPYTWEVELSATGKKRYASPEAKQAAIRQKWEELVNSGRLGYMAMLRNLRNLLYTEVSAETLNVVCDTLSDAEAVKRSKQLPFRYLAAFNEIATLRSDLGPMVLAALEKAALVSAENIRGFDANTRVLIASDASGSMCKPLSARSSVVLYDVGLVLSMLLQSRSRRVRAGIFGSTWKEVGLPHGQILSNAGKLKKLLGTVGYATKGHLVIDALYNERSIVDKVLIFTDMQLWDTSGFRTSLKKSWDRYRKQIAPDARLYIFDLAGYGQAPIQLIRKDVALIAGWSDKIFDVLNSIEQGESTLSEILKIQI